MICHAGIQSEREKLGGFHIHKKQRLRTAHNKVAIETDVRQEYAGNLSGNIDLSLTTLKPFFRVGRIWRSFFLRDAQIQISSLYNIL